MSKTKDSKSKHIPKEEADAWDAFASPDQSSLEIARSVEWEIFIKSIEKKNAHRLNLAKLDTSKTKVNLTSHQPDMPKEIAAIVVSSLDRNERKILQEKGGVERFIDLHGLRKEDAFRRVYSAILTAYERNTKILKIITGKGRDHRDEFGELYVSIKSILPQWLAMPQLQIKIRKVTPAIDADGGKGAFYVYLKKRQ